MYPYLSCVSLAKFVPNTIGAGGERGAHSTRRSTGRRELAIELPYETASAMFARLSGLSVSSERLHTLTNQVAEGLKVVGCGPASCTRLIGWSSRSRRAVFAVRCWCLVLMGPMCRRVPRALAEAARVKLASEPEERGGRHAWHEAKGFRFYLLDGERIVHVFSWHQVQSDAELGKALKQIKEAGLIPEETVRLCVIGDGADWIWKDVQTLLPERLSGARRLPLFRVSP